MFTKKITDDDNFIALSSSAQALYLHLSMAADDDGFTRQVSTAMFRAHASVQDIQALLENRYIYQFESGVIVIKHWRMANALRKDRYTPTIYKSEMAMLGLDEHGAYTRGMDTIGCQDGNQTATQYRLDKVRVDKDRLGEDIQEETDTNVSVKKKSVFTPPTVEEVSEYCFEQNLGIDPEAFVDYYNANGWMIGGKAHMKDWRAAARNWDRKRKADKNSPNNRYLTKGEQAKKDMDDFYQMTREWIEESTNDVSGIR